jgi:hypothetical protein
MTELGSELNKLRNLVKHIDRKVRSKVDSSKILDEVYNYIYKVELTFGVDARKKEDKDESSI